MTEGIIEKSEIKETVLSISRVSKKIPGGNKIGFRTVVAVGDGAGKVGIGIGKAPELRSAIIKAGKRAKKSMIEVPLKGFTIPHPIEVSRGAAHLILKPAPRGSGLIAGGAVRTMAQLAGIKDISAKILGTNNKTSNAQALMEAFKLLKADKSEK